MDSCASFRSCLSNWRSNIYSAEHLHETQNKITEDINEKNKPNFMLHGLSSVLKCAVQQNLFFSGQREKWKTGIAN